jgi:hypothetical protein
MATNADLEFDKQNTETDDIVQGGDTVDNSYASSRNEPVPVLKDEVPVEQPNDTRNPDSDKALGEYPAYCCRPAIKPPYLYLPTTKL